LFFLKILFNAPEGDFLFIQIKQEHIYYHKIHYMTFETLFTAGIGILSSIITYFVGLKKSKAETDSLVLQNVQGILKIQTETIEALKHEVDELKKKIEDYEDYIDELKSQIKAMRKEMNNK